MYDSRSYKPSNHQSLAVDEEFQSFVALNSYYETGNSNQGMAEIKANLPKDYSDNEQEKGSNQVSSLSLVDNEISKPMQKNNFPNETKNITNQNPKQTGSQSGPSSGGSSLDFVEVAGARFIIQGDTFQSFDGNTKEQSSDSITCSKCGKQDTSKQLQELIKLVKSKDDELINLKAETEQAKAENHQYRIKTGKEINRLTNELTLVISKYNSIKETTNQQARSKSGLQSARGSATPRGEHDSNSDFSKVKELKNDIDIMLGFFVKLVDKSVVEENDKNILKTAIFKIIKLEEPRGKFKETQGLFLKTGEVLSTQNSRLKLSDNHMKSFPSLAQSTTAQSEKESKTIWELKEKCAGLESKVHQVCTAYSKAITRFEDDIKGLRWRQRVLHFSFDSLYNLLSSACKKKGRTRPEFAQYCKEYFSRVQSLLEAPPAAQSLTENSKFDSLKGIMAEITAELCAIDPRLY